MARRIGDIAVKNLETGEWELLAQGAFPVYSPSGHIVYQTNRYESGLWALPFSLETLKPTGEAFPIAEDVGQPSVAADGSLVSVDQFDAGQQQLLWRDRKGKKLGVIGRPQQNIRYPVLSPDGRRVAAESTEDGNRDVSVHEAERALRTRLTFAPAQDTRPVWSPSGEEIIFQSDRHGKGKLRHLQPAFGTVPASLYCSPARIWMSVPTTGPPMGSICSTRSAIGKTAGTSGT